MTVIPPSDDWVEFLDLYRRLPALWKYTNDIYKNKRSRDVAYKKLLVCYRKIDPLANIVSMRRRINSIRTCFRREMRKVEHSELMAQNGGDVYVPVLWYYKELAFLRNEIRARDAARSAVDDASESFLNDDDADVLEDVEDDEPMEELQEKQEDDHFIAEDTKVEQRIEEVCESPLNISLQDHTRPSMDMSLNHTQMLPPLIPANHHSRDEATIYAEGWAISYRKLDERNRLLAKKAIEEILVLGQLNQLEFNSVRIPH